MSVQQLIWDHLGRKEESVENRKQRKQQQHLAWMKQHPTKNSEYSKRRYKKQRNDPKLWATYLKRRREERRKRYHDDPAYRARVLSYNEKRWKKALIEPERYAKLSVIRKRDYAKNWSKRMIPSAKRRAEARGLPCDITAADIVRPKYCPVMGFELNYHGTSNRAYSPSLDRIENTKGYIKGNVIVVCRLVNSIKQNVTWRELLRVAEFYRRLDSTYDALPDWPAIV